MQAEVLARKRDVAIGDRSRAVYKDTPEPLAEDNTLAIKMADGRLTFAALDYMVCGLSIVLSLAIGLFYVYRDGRERTIESYLMADRKMSALPVALSYFMTMLSGIAFLSDPVEVYNYGQAYIGEFCNKLYRCRILKRCTFELIVHECHW